MTGPVNLLPTLTNQRFAGLVGQLNDRIKAPGPPWQPARRTARRVRYGSVERAVLSVFARTDHPLTIRQVVGEVQADLGANLRYSSVKSCLAKLVGSEEAPLRRLSRGRYAYRS